MSEPGQPEFVLASTSRYRRELLARLIAQFRQVAPDIDETPRFAESAGDLATRLAREKAQAVAARCPGAVIVASDQAADLHGSILGKPGDARRAQAQLASASGQTVTFHTALCLIDGRCAEAMQYDALDVTRVRFRELDAVSIARYVERDRPFDCAGSFKVEALGIALFERIDSHDPTALVGLPLIALASLLRTAGIDVI